MADIPLQRLVNSAETKKEVCGSDLGVGDFVFVVTCHSLYTIMAEDERAYRVSDRRFDKKGLSPVTTSIAGCMWGAGALRD